MRKSGWAAATGIGSLALLLAACGGSPGANSAAGSGSSAPLASGGSSGAAVPSTAPASSATAASTATKSAGSTASNKAKPHKSVAPLPSGGDQSIPARGTTVMIVQKSAVGYVLAEANHQVVYTYSKDKKGGKPTCTGACAETWIPATGTPEAGPADVFPGQFGLVTGAGGVKQITYDGHPLYLLKGAKPLTVTGNGQGGVWHVVPLSASDIRT
jgi:predicted lipoprotein with Yx(FWY)xxD motif